MLPPILVTTIQSTPTIFWGANGNTTVRVPLGISIVGDLIVSQALTLFTMPVIYLYFECAAKALEHRRHVRHGVLDEKAGSAV